MSRRLPRRIAVIGAGWAGCAAAVELARQGHVVTLFEAARTLGGRARRVDLNDLALDNGQHILLGAYSETLRLLKLVGISQKTALLRLPLQMRYPPGGMDFVTPRLPAPLHMLVGLLRARGLQSEDKLSLARFSTTARWMGWRLNTDCSVTELLDRFDQTDRLIQLMWRPLCIAALNTPPERASAQVFLNVLRDSLGARRAASDMLVPRVDLSALFPASAAAYIEANGGQVVLGKAISGVRHDENGWRLEVETASEPFDAVIVATQPAQAASLLGELMDTRILTGLAYEPITTCYLQYPSPTRLEHPFLALVDDAATGVWGQYVFDRGQLDARQAGLFSVVISASTEAIALGHEALSHAVANQLASALGRSELASPAWTKVISEKRATFSCTPAVERPGNETGVDGLILAGDYTAGEYPATLESAIRSGVQAARCAVR
jgi:hydroxysqualene dehydroxylase